MLTGFFRHAIQRGEMRLTKSIIDKIEYDGKDAFYWDDLLKGFGLKVTRSSKTYIVQSRVNRRTVRKKVGAYGVYTPEEARKQAKIQLGFMANNVDVNIEDKKAKRRKTTLQQAFDDYIKLKNITTATKVKYERSMRLSFEDWKNKPINSINREMVERRFKNISQRSPAIANSDFRFLRALLNFAMEQYAVDGEPLIPSNPCSRLSILKLWNRVERRQTYIHPTKIKTFFEGLQFHKDDSDYMQTVKNQCLFILFTGCRDQEAGCLRWDNIDFELKTLTFNNTKNHKTHILPMGNYLFSFMQELKRKSSRPFVFPANNKSGHIENQRKAVQMLAEQSGIQFTLHDIRRTFASIANNHIPGITNFTLKKLLNHSESDVTAGYIQFEIESLRRPMQMIEDFILEQVGIQQRTNNEKIVKFENRKEA